MRSVEVKVYTPTTSFTFKDENDGAGLLASSQIGAGSMVHALSYDDDDPYTDYLLEVYIPFHAIEVATVDINDSLAPRADVLCGEEI